MGLTLSANSPSRRDARSAVRTGDPQLSAGAQCVAALGTRQLSIGRARVSQVEVIDRARDDDVMVYGIGMRSRGARPMRQGTGPGGLQAMLTADRPDPGLGRVAEETAMATPRFGSERISAPHLPASPTSCTVST